MNYTNELINKLWAEGSFLVARTSKGLDLVISISDIGQNLKRVLEQYRPSFEVSERVLKQAAVLLSYSEPLNTDVLLEVTAVTDLFNVLNGCSFDEAISSFSENKYVVLDRRTWIYGKEAVPGISSRYMRLEDIPVMTFMIAVNHHARNPEEIRPFMASFLKAYENGLRLKDFDGRMYTEDFLAVMLKHEDKDFSVCEAALSSMAKPYILWKALVDPECCPWKFARADFIRNKASKKGIRQTLANIKAGTLSPFPKQFLGLPTRIIQDIIENGAKKYIKPIVDGLGVSGAEATELFGAGKYEPVAFMPKERNYKNTDSWLFARWWQAKKDSAIWNREKIYHIVDNVDTPATTCKAKYRAFLDEIQEEDLINGWKTSVETAIEHALNRRHNLSNRRNIVLPECPIKGTDTIVQVRDTRGLYLAGQKFKNCVGGYEWACKYKQSYIFVSDTACIEVRMKDGSFYLNQVYGKCNSDLPDETLAEINLWFSRELNRLGCLR